MDDTPIRPRAARQRDCLARYQLLDDGLLAGWIDRWAAGVRTIYPGVHVLGWSPLTVEQRWWAATLTTRDTVLAQASAAAHWGIRPDPGHVVTVLRPGSRGRSRFDDVLVSYSTTLAADTLSVDGLRVTSPPRVLLDLWPYLSRAGRARILSECLRLKRATAEEIVAITLREPRRRGASDLRDAAQRYSRLPFHRCKSPAEGQALIVLDAAGVQIPRVNEIFAGEEADLCWPERRLIIEIDGGSFHVLKDHDARKEAAWRAAGFTVRRIPSDLVYSDPDILLALVARG